MKVAGVSKIHWQGRDAASSVMLFFDEPPSTKPNAITAVVIGSTRHKVTGYREVLKYHVLTVEWSAAGVSVGDDVAIEAAL